MASPRVIQQAGRATLLIPTQPLANGGHGGGEQLRGGFDAALFSTLHQAQAMVIGVFHFTHPIEIPSGDGHDNGILRGARGPAPPPLRRAARPAPKYKSNSFLRFSLIHFNLARGDTM
jgi:hypothetical protein